MPKTREEKREILAVLRDKIGRSKSIVFTKFEKLNVKENEELRNKLRAEGSEYYVAKKTLFDLAFSENKIEGLNPRSFDGKVAALFGYNDEVVAAKTVDEFRKGLSDEEKGKIEFLGGILEGRFLTKEEVINLANVPSKPELYAKLVGSLNAPISGFVNALAGNLKNLVYVLKAIEEKKS